MPIEQPYEGIERREDHALREAIDELKKRGVDAKEIEAMEAMLNHGYANMSLEEVGEREGLRKKLAAAYNMPEDTPWDALTKKVEETLDREK